MFKSIQKKNQRGGSQNIQKRMLNHDLCNFFTIQLDHPNIVQVYEVYDNADYFYIVMQYMEGGQLCDQKNLVRCKTEGQICQIVRTITDALDFCHSKNIVHRDMKVNLSKHSQKIFCGPLTIMRQFSRLLISVLLKFQQTL